MVPMHLGLIDGPFVPHNLILIQGSPVPWLKFQMAPRLKISMASGSKKGTQIYFSYLSKVLANEPPPGSPTGPLWRGRPLYRAFCISEKPHLLGFPVKEPCLKAPLMESLAERCPTTRALLLSSIKVPGIRAPPHTHTPQVPLGRKGAPMERDARVWRLSQHIFLGAQWRSSHAQTPSMEPLQGERSFIHRGPFIHLSKSPLDEPSSRFPKRSPYERRCPSPEPFSTYPSGSPVRESSLQVPLAELPQRERETLSPWSPCQPYLKVPDRGVQSRWPNWAPMRREAHSQSLPFITFRAPNKEAPHQVPLKVLP